MPLIDNVYSISIATLHNVKTLSLTWFACVDTSYKSKHQKYDQIHLVHYNQNFSFLGYPKHSTNSTLQKKDILSPVFKSSHG